MHITIHSLREQNLRDVKVTWPKVTQLRNGEQEEKSSLTCQLYERCQVVGWSDLRRPRGGDPGAGGVGRGPQTQKIYLSLLTLLVPDCRLVSSKLQTERDPVIRRIRGDPNQSAPRTPSVACSEMTGAMVPQETLEVLPDPCGEGEGGCCGCCVSISTNVIIPDL